MPIPTVAALIIKDSKVLLVRHGSASRYADPMVGLPSGRLEPNEPEITAAARELKEETGLEAKENDLTEFPDNYYVATLTHKDGTREYGWRVFLCKDYSGELKGSDETTPFWQDIAKLDGLPLLPNVKSAVLAGLNFIKSQT